MVAKLDVKITKNDLPKLLRQSPAAADRAIEALAREGERYSKTLMGTSPPGRTYTRERTTHTASRPGFPPNIDTGTLVNSIHVEPAGRMKRLLVDGTEYGVFLEFGATNLAPRPFFGPTVLWLQDEAPRIFRGLLD